MKVSAIEVVHGQYLLVTTLSSLASHSVVNPEWVDRAKQSDVEKPFNAALRGARDMRGNNQRSWATKARRERRDSYANYIQAVRNGDRLGGFPPITMWTKSPVTYADGEIDIPGDAVLCAHDGETQLSAWFDLGDNRDAKYYNSPIAVVLYTEATQALADQQLHDFNHYASPVSESEMALHNREGALTAAVREGLLQSGRQIDLVVNRRTDSLGKRFLTTEARLLEMAVGAAYGADGFNSPTRKLTERGNAQFSELPSAATVSQCLAEFMAFSEEDMRPVTKPVARALGVYFSQHGTFPRYLPTADDVEKAKDATVQKSKPIQAIAQALYSQMNKGKRAA